MSFTTPTKKTAAPATIDSGYASSSTSMFATPGYAIDEEIVPSAGESGSEYAPSDAGASTPTPTSPVFFECFTFPLADKTLLSTIEPASSAIVLNPTRKYVHFLEEQMAYVFLAFRFASVCVALLRFDMAEQANQIGQYAVNLLGSGMFLTCVEKYLEGTSAGDDIVSIKYVLVDLIEDIEARLDARAGTHLGAQLRTIVRGCDLTYNPNEIPAVVADDCASQEAIDD